MSQPIVMRATPVEVIRVHLPGGGHHDHDAFDFHVSKDGLTPWQETAWGSRQTVAVYAPGEYVRAERVLANTPPPTVTEGAPAKPQPGIGFRHD